MDPAMDTMTEDQLIEARKVHDRMMVVYSKLLPRIVLFVESQMVELGTKPDDTGSWNGVALSYLSLGAELALFLGSDEETFVHQTRLLFRAAIAKRQAESGVAESDFAKKAATEAMTPKPQEKPATPATPATNGHTEAIVEQAAAIGQAFAIGHATGSEEAVMSPATPATPEKKPRSKKASSADPKPPKS